MDKILNILAVGLGGALGSMLRYGVTLLFASMSWTGNAATMVVNVLGSFLIGYLSGSLEQSTLLLLLTVGFCGGFTTFSTFSSQSFRLFQDGRFGAMALYIALSVILCVVFAGLGWTIAGHTSK